MITTTFYFFVDLILVMIWYIMDVNKQRMLWDVIYKSSTLMKRRVGSGGSYGRKFEIAVVFKKTVIGDSAIYILVCAYLFSDGFQNRIKERL